MTPRWLLFGLVCPAAPPPEREEGLILQGRHHCVLNLSRGGGRTDVCLDKLQTNGKKMVAAANTIYLSMLGAMKVLVARQVPWTIENPERSLLWWIPEVDMLMQTGANDVLYHACMHGSMRLKSQRLCGPLGSSCLSAECDNTHQHLPWRSKKQLFTSEEAE